MQKSRIGMQYHPHCTCKLDNLLQRRQRCKEKQFSWSQKTLEVPKKPKGEKNMGGDTRNAKIVASS